MHHHGEMNKMTNNEFLSYIKSRGAKIYASKNAGAINIANINLQKIRAAMLPNFLIELYNVSSGITMGSACIFGPSEIERTGKYPLPSIIQINTDIAGNKNLFGKTVFGRNDLFWFATDALGNCFMLDNLTLSVLKKYDNPHQAMIDCLIIGKI